MPPAKVAIVAVPNERADLIIGMAPSDLDIFLVDINLPEEEKTARCRDADAIISSNVSTELLSQCPNVKLVQTLSAGFDMLDLEAIGELGIPVANNGGANAVSVSEQVIGTMVALFRKTLVHWENAMRRRLWQEGLGTLYMTEITGKTVGIVGLGRVGKQVARRLVGFDTRTIYYDVAEIPPEDRERLNAEPVGFEELLADSDVVTLHVPLNRQTRKMISDRELGLMKQSAYLINACRGPVVDEKALYRALTEGTIAGAGLDVTEEEPTPPDNPLFDLDNVIISPHQAGYSQETNYRAADFAYANIRRVVAGEPPESLVLPED
ncbi:MAG: 2-hydroxyacid dehydrogenase [Dehalococcoidia bacterium]